MKDGILAYAKVSSRQQISVPKEIRERLKVAEGDFLVFFEDRGRIYIKKGTLTPAE